MDKNTITGFVLIGLVLIGFNWLSRPSQEELNELARQDSIAALQKEQAEKQEKITKERAWQRAESTQETHSPPHSCKTLPCAVFFMPFKLFRIAKLPQLVYNSY